MKHIVKSWTETRIAPAFIGMLACTWIAISTTPSALASNAERRKSDVNPNRAVFDPVRHVPGYIVVKFNDDSPIRLRNGNLTDFGTGMFDDAQPILQNLADNRWTRVTTVNEARLDELRETAQKNHGRAIPNLNTYFYPKLPPDADPDATLDAFNNMKAVEFAIPIPIAVPMTRLASTTTPTASQIMPPPDLEHKQGYLNNAPIGIGARFAWEVLDTRGEGVKIMDIESTFNADHDDLPDVTVIGPAPEPGHHGTAVLGMLGSLNNGWGTTGIAHGSDFFFGISVTDSVPNYYVNSILDGANELDLGDVILIEVQVKGPNYANDSTQFGMLPVEWHSLAYGAILHATGNNINVIVPAGNGFQDLHSAVNAPGDSEHFPFENDSGAIYVGAGAAPAEFGGDFVARSRLCYSNYGERVNMQGWGERVWTTGYGNAICTDQPCGSLCCEYDGDGYTGCFAGTSSAAPMAAGAVALLQSAFKQKFDTLIPTSVLRQVLITTGSPQQDFGAWPAKEYPIGPLPNIAAAAVALGLLDVDPDFDPSGTIYVPLHFATIQDAIDASETGAEIIVTPGTYYGTINLKGKAIHLRSTGGPELTIIDGLGAGPVVTCSNGEGSETIIEGFTITGGHVTAFVIGGGGGMYNGPGTSPTVTNCIFKNNSAHASAGTGQMGRGGGMYNNGSSPTVTNCIFQNNEVRGAFLVGTNSRGGGMANWNNSNPTVKNCLFEDNWAFGGFFVNGRGGGMANGNDSNPVVIGSIFRFNWAANGGSGMWNDAESHPEISNTLFCENSPNHIVGPWDDLGGNEFNDDCPASAIASVSPPLRSVGMSAGATSFSVSNTGAGLMPWSASVISGHAWLRITTGSSGVNSGIIFAGYDANPDPGSRTGTIRVSSPAASPSFVDIQVEQAGVAGRPQVIARAPQPGATQVPPDQIIEAAFDADLRAATVTSQSVRLLLETSGLTATPWAGIVTLDDGSRKIVLEPVEALRSGGRYRVVLSSLISGSDGVSIEPTSWTFTVADTTSRDRVIEAIWALRVTAKATLHIHRDLAALNLSRGLLELWGDFWVETAQNAFLIFSKVARGNVPLFGPGARVSNGFRTFFSVYAKWAKPLDDVRVGAGYASGLISRANLVRTLGFDGASYVANPPDYNECVQVLDQGLQVEDRSFHPPSVHVGIVANIAAMDAMIDEALDAVPGAVSYEDAEAAVLHLERVRRKLVESRTRETPVAITVQGEVGPLLCIQAVLGQTTSVSRQIEKAIERIQSQQSAKWMITLSTVGLTGAKIGAVALSGGAGAIALADLVPLLTSGVVGVIETVATRSEAVVTPKEALVHGIYQSVELLGQDAGWQLYFLRQSLREVLDLAAGLGVGGRVPRAARGSAAGDCVVAFGAEATVPDIDLDVSPIGLAEVTLYNDCPLDVAVLVVGTIHIPGVDGTSSILGFSGPEGMIELSANQEKVVQFPYGAPRSALVSKEGFLMRINGTALIPGAAELQALDPVERRFRVGSAAELDLLSPHGEQIAVAGLIEPGQDASHWFDFAAGLHSVEFRLSPEPGSEMDLHLYDPFGNHTGHDYEAGDSETNVPKSTYTGVGSDPQVIRVTEPLEGVYRLRVVGHGNAGAYTVTTVGLPPLSAMMSFLPQTVSLYGWPGMTIEFDVGLMEWGGTEGIQDVEFTAGDLLAEDGEAISADRFGSLALLPMIGSGGREFLVVTLTLPADAVSGDYEGFIEANGAAAGPGDEGSGVELAAALQVSVSIREQGDVNGDGSIDLLDFSALQWCFGLTGSAGDCAAFAFGFDSETEIELDHFSLFHASMTGPQ